MDGDDKVRRRRLVLLAVAVWSFVAPVAGVGMLALGEGAVKTAGAVLLGVALVSCFGSTVLLAVMRSRSSR